MSLTYTRHPRRESPDKLANYDAKCLEFFTTEAYTPSGRYHAFGAYVLHGKIVVRHAVSSFANMVPHTALDLFRDDRRHPDEEQENARYLLSRWTGLPETFVSWMERAGRGESGQVDLGEK